MVTVAPPPGLKGYGLMSNSSRSSQTLDVVDGGSGIADVAGGSGAGGSWGPPPSAIATTASRQERERAASSFFNVGVSPFFGLGEQDSITDNPRDPLLLFADFWTLRCSGRIAEALAVCDSLLEILDPADYDSHVRHRNALAMVQRDGLRFLDSYRTHLSARPLLAHCSENKYIGGHHHGLAWSLMELGHLVPAYKHFQLSRHYYESDPARVALADNNTALLLVRMNRPAEAHALIDAALKTWQALGQESLCGEAEHARALAFEAQGKFKQALKCAGRSLLLLADGDNKLARVMSRATYDRIEGKL